MKGNKAYSKRLRVTKTGKILSRKAGGNHYNAKESRSVQLKRKRGMHITLTPKLRTRFLPGK
jgi:ribosomal protein L35